jgi:hypothetical protein
VARELGEELDVASRSNDRRGELRCSDEHRFAVDEKHLAPHRVIDRTDLDSVDRQRATGPGVERDADPARAARRSRDALRAREKRDREHGDPALGGELGDHAPAILFAHEHERSSERERDPRGEGEQHGD